MRLPGVDRGRAVGGSADLQNKEPVNYAPRNEEPVFKFCTDLRNYPDLHLMLRSIFEHCSGDKNAC